MNSKRYTFFLLNSLGTPIKTANLSNSVIYFCALLIFGSLCGFGLLINDYLALRQIRPEKKRMSEQISDQTHTIAQQRKQIQILASKINDIKTHLIVLNEFEKKVRIITNLEQKDDQNHFLGMGGSTPDDISTSLPLSENHTQLIRKMHDQVETVSSASNVQQKSFQVLLDKLEDRRNILAATPSLRPVDGWVTSRFGYRKSPFTDRKEFHKGLDIATRKGTLIIAPADGVVTFAASRGLMGNMLTINHGYGIITRYGHIHKFMKKRGDRVKRGETIALVGNTGRSTGPHVHYEVHLNGVPVNPEKYILN
ncbi:MAG: M23 family metallopeptidase [Desulfobacteraceae bacterium]|jgi:septal ring factor EnvC (AmiA/AmiB activator)